MDKILVIAGPTASGKSKAARILASKLDGEIINADTRAFYRGMDIGTAKPSKADRKKYLYHLIDIAEPNQTVTLAEFQKLANDKIREIQNRGRTPIIEGGTPLFINAIVYDYKIPKVPPNERLRARLERKSASNLYRMLRKVDIVTAKKIDRHNKRRLIRALEVEKSTKKSFYGERSKSGIRPGLIFLGIDIERAKLSENIRRRAIKMFSGEFEREVTGLAKRFDFSLPAFSAIGYRDMLDYVLGKMTKQEALASVISGTERLVKKQMTWLKHNPDIQWFKNAREALRIIRHDSA